MAMYITILSKDHDASLSASFPDLPFIGAPYLREKQRHREMSGRPGELLAARCAAKAAKDWSPPSTQAKRAIVMLVLATNHAGARDRGIRGANHRARGSKSSGFLAGP